LHPNQRVTQTGEILLERKAWYQIWIHQFLGQRFFVFYFLICPRRCHQPKHWMGLKNRIEKPEDYHLFVTQQNFAVFGESTKRARSLEIA